MPEADVPDKPKAKGGPAFHREGCGCNPCAARRRASEALAIANGEGGADPEASPTASSGVNLPATTTGGRIARRHVAEWVRLRAEEPDLTQTDVARRLGIAPKTLRNQIYNARKAGWLTFEDPIDELEYGILPKVVKNLNKFLDEGDKTVTIEAAKGTLFPQFREEKGVGISPTTILAIKLEMPEAVGDAAQIVTGKIVGRPRQFVEAEVVAVAESDT